MLERILIPMDGSEVAESVLRRSKLLLKRPGTEVLLLRTTGMMPSASFDSSSLQATLHAEAETYLERLKRRLEAEGVRVRTLVRDGLAADLILGTASREGVTLILMSTHGRTGLSRWVFGSVAEKVLRASDTPVLVARAFGPEAPVYPPRKIVVPVDDSECSMEVLSAVETLAKAAGSRVAVLNVMEHGTVAGPVSPCLERAYGRLKEAGIPCEPVLRRGDPAEQILEAARDFHADLVALTTHGRSGVGRWVLGSITEKVLRTAPVSLLVTRVKGASVPESGALQSAVSRR